MGNTILVTFTPKQKDVLESLNGLMGHSNSEIVRTIVMAWLSEQDYLVKTKLK